VSPELTVICASLCWCTASQYFSYLGTRIAIKKLNLYKSIVSFLAFFVFALFQGKLFVSKEPLSYLLISGISGFAIGDIFIFYGFSQLGAARTLMITSFSPGILALFSYLFIGESLSLASIMGLVSLIFCLLFLGLDKDPEASSRSQFTIKLGGIVLLGVAFDAFGVMLSKKAFITDPELGSMTANTYRIFVAIIFLLIFHLVKREPVGISDIHPKDFKKLVGASLLGTFLALYLYLDAISRGNTATISAIGSLAPIYASIYEYGKARRLPSKWFLLSIISMLAGLYLLLLY